MSDVKKGLTALGAVLLLNACWTWHKANRYWNAAVHTDGIAVELAGPQAKNAPFPAIRFKDQLGKSRVFTPNRRFAPEEIVKVIYPPYHPQNASLAEFRAYFLQPLLQGLFALALLAFGLWDVVKLNLPV